MCGCCSLPTQYRGHMELWLCFLSKLVTACLPCSGHSGHLQQCLPPKLDPMVAVLGLDTPASCHRTLRRLAEREVYSTSTHIHMWGHSKYIRQIGRGVPGRCSPFRRGSMMSNIFWPPPGINFPDLHMKVQAHLWFRFQAQAFVAAVCDLTHVRAVTSCIHNPSVTV